MAIRHTEYYTVDLNFATSTVGKFIFRGTEDHVNTTQPTELPGNDFDPVKAEAGAIAGAVFGVLISVGFITFACVMYIRKKRERDLEYTRRTKVLIQSSQSAGVYVDTTQELSHGRTKNINNRGSEYKSLQKDPNMYESDSEDEL